MQLFRLGDGPKLQRVGADRPSRLSSPRERWTMNAFNMFGVSYVAAIAVLTFAAVAAL